MIDIDFARLNHILIPSTRTGRDRLRNSRVGRLSRVLFAWIFGVLTPEGSLVALLVVIVGVLGLDVSATAAWLLFCPLAGVFLASVLAARFYPLARVRLDVRAPARVLPGETVSFELTLVNEGPKGYGPIALSGPFLPYDGVYEGQAPTLRALAPFASVTVVCRAKFSARGPHQLDGFRAGALVPLGLATGRRIEDSGVKFMVIPRPARVRTLPVPHERTALQSAGTRAALARAVSDARELRGVRPYRPGDRVRDLHARRWARTGTPVVREYQPELDPRVAVLLDLPREGTTMAQREATLSLAAGLLSKLVGDGQATSLMLDGSFRRVLEIDPGRSVDAALDALGELEPRLRGDPTYDPHWFERSVQGPRPCQRAFLVTPVLGASHTALLAHLEQRGCDAHALLVTRDARREGPLDARVRRIETRAITANDPIDLR